jgi:hypothetical protein
MPPDVPPPAGQGAPAGQTPPAPPPEPAAATPPAAPPPAVPAATTAPAATPAVAAAPAAAPAAPPATTVEGAPAGAPPDPNWLKQRFAQNEKAAQAKLLKDLGVTTVDEAKAKIEASKKLEDEKKSEIQRAQDQVKALEPVAQRGKKLEETVNAYAAREMATLTEAQRTTVVGLAGEDPAAQLETIEKLKAGGLLAPPAPPPPAAGAPPAPARPAVPPPASTTSAGGAPPPASASTPDHKAVYESLQKTNPVAASHYALRHEDAIFGTGQSS